MTDTTVRVALLQTAPKPGEKEDNLAAALELAEREAKEADLIALPEFFATGYHLDLLGDRFYELSELIPGPSSTAFCEVAARNNCAILVNMPERDPLQDGVLYDTTCYINARGEIAGTYRKIHLFPAEHSYFRAGNEPVMWELSGIRLAAATCFDHAFPELFTIYALRGAHLVVIPSAVPVGYEHLLKLRSRARAQDNQYWVCAVNRGGREGDLTYCGGSMIVNPAGKVVSGTDSIEETVVRATIDSAEVAAQRLREPYLRSRRTELYGP